MASLNKVMLIGNVCSQPESITTPSGTVIGKVRLAVGRSKKNQQTGQWEADPATVYMDCKCFYKDGDRRNLPDVIARMVSVGTSLYIEGRLSDEEWTDKSSGAKRNKTVIMIDSLEILSSKQQNQQEGGGDEQEQPRQQQPQRGGYQQRQPQGQRGGQEYPPPEVDIPF